MKLLIDNKGDGIPLLFVPGNAGSYKQARSLATELNERSHQLRNFHYDVFTGIYDSLN